MNAMVGVNISNYEIQAPIGEGGMGVVYLARHSRLGRRVAIKILRDGHLANAGDDRMVELFVKEARAANAIRHPNIIEVLDVGRLACGKPYLMMELLEGETLGDRLRRMTVLPLEEALDVVQQAARGLAAAHAEGVVHLDLKPDNLFLCPDPGRPHGERVKVLDFGIAKLRGEPPIVPPGAETTTIDDSGPERPGSLIFGSPYYMSPEQCRGDDALIDHRTYVYAMGALLYHLLCGAPPFVDDTLIEVLIMHLRQPPRPPRALNPQIPPHVETAILRALAKHPEQRFASMDELIAALGVEGAFEEGPPPAAARARTWRPAFIALGAAAVLAAAVIWPPRHRAVPSAAAPVAARAPAAPPPAVMGPPLELAVRRTRPPAGRAPADTIVTNDALWGRRH